MLIRNLINYYQVYQEQRRPSGSTKTPVCFLSFSRRGDGKNERIFVVVGTNTTKLCMLQKISVQGFKTTNKRQQRGLRLLSHLSVIKELLRITHLNLKYEDKKNYVYKLLKPVFKHYHSSKCKFAETRVNQSVRP